jgi:hypothetical protein
METPISFIHQTSDGPVHLLVKNSKLGWDSFHWGRNLAGAWTFNTLGEANQYVLRQFRKLYYAHRCSGACRPVNAITLHRYDDPWGMIRE